VGVFDESAKTPANIKANKANLKYFILFSLVVIGKRFTPGILSDKKTIFPKRFGMAWTMCVQNNKLAAETRQLWSVFTDAKQHAP
jgi:hypothetical protein